MAAAPLIAVTPILANLLASGMFALGCGLLTMFLLRRSYKYFGRRRKRNEPAIDAQPRPDGAWSGAHADASARIERQQVELYDLGREMTARIDNKMILLQELIAKSQSQIDRLEELLADAEANESETLSSRRM